MGYIKSTVTFSYTDNEPMLLPVLVVPATKYSDQVPVIVKTDIPIFFQRFDN